MGMQFSTALRNARADAISTTLGAAGTLRVFTGTPPGVASATTGTQLCTLTAVTYAAAANGTKTFTATSDTNAAATGTPGYARLYTSGGVAHTEFDAGVGSGTMNFASAVSAGATVSLSSATFTEGNP